MGPLKLFVSHSSRLDDIDHAHADADANWQLLAQTCSAIRAHYGDRVQVLVDDDGLIPGDDWNRKLDLWLAECHAAVVLVSRRAIQKSAWVAKEAAILSWRAALNDGFKLVAVPLADEVSVAEVTESFLGKLGLDRFQAAAAARTPGEVLAEVRAALGEPADLASRFPMTPLELMRDGVASLIVDAGTTTRDSIDAALARLGCSPVPDTGQGERHFAEQLARRFFESPEEDPAGYLGSFQIGVDQLRPKPVIDRALALFEAVRPLWVDPGAASLIPRALGHSMVVALAGALVNYSEGPSTVGFTLERYLERAWPGSRLWVHVPVTARMDAEAVRAEIHRQFYGDSPVAPPAAKDRDRYINDDPKSWIVVVSATPDDGGIPDPAKVEDLLRLHGWFDKLLLLLALPSEQRALPERIEPFPPLEVEREQAAFFAERGALAFMRNKYPEHAWAGGEVRAQ